VGRSQQGVGGRKGQALEEKRGGEKEEEEEEERSTWEEEEEVSWEENDETSEWEGVRKDVERDRLAGEEVVSKNLLQTFSMSGATDWNDACTSAPNLTKAGQEDR
jgi:hypothetical protein